MLYAIISQDVENNLEKRLSVRPAHIERLEKLKEQGRLIIAGPHPAIDNNEPGPAGFTEKPLRNGQITIHIFNQAHMSL